MINDGKLKFNTHNEMVLCKLEGKYTEWPNPQIRGENRQSGLTD